MNNRLEQNPSRISFDPGHVDVDALDEIADGQDKSRAELIRATLAEVVEEYDDADGENASLRKPDHSELCEAFEQLLEASNHPQGPRKLTVDEARGKLHSQTCPKAQIVSRLLRPLADDGFISVMNGRITVHRRTVEQVQQAEAEADDAISRLESVAADEPDYREVAEPHQQLLKYHRAELEPPFELAAWTARQTLWADGGRNACSVDTGGNRSDGGKP